MRKRLLAGPGLFLLSVSFSARGQSTDSMLYARAVSNAVQVHEKLLKDQLPILNGSVFVEYPYTIISGSPYFSSGHFQPGSVDYDDVAYADIPLVYDDLSGEVIARLTLDLRLVTEKIKSFSILDHRFVRLSPKVMASASGFYEWISAGRVNLYKKVTKKFVFQRQKGVTGIFAAVQENVSYLLEQNGQVYPVDNKNQLLLRLKDKSEEIKKYLRTSGLIFENSNYEYGLLKVIACYNGTNP